MMDRSPERVEYNHASKNHRNIDTNNRTYALEEEFAAMDINLLARISEYRVLQEHIQVDV